MVSYFGNSSGHAGRTCLSGAPGPLPGFGSCTCGVGDTSVWLTHFVEAFHSPAALIEFRVSYDLTGGITLRNGMRTCGIGIRLYIIATATFLRDAVEQITRSSARRDCAMHRHNRPRTRHDCGGSWNDSAKARSAGGGRYERPGPSDEGCYCTSGHLLHTLGGRSHVTQRSPQSPSGCALLLSAET
jgi:hypothetical protein